MSFADVIGLMAPPGGEPIKPVPGIITLTTDFGLKDPYLGEMKGAILSINPGARLVDITHQIGPGDILEGSLILGEAYSYFPEGTVHLGVVDPGVGGRRRPVLIETRRYFFVGPDNGLFARALEGERTKRVIHLKDKRYFLKEISNTFHGRDIFGPVAAHLSAGVSPESFGPRVKRTAPLDIPPVRKSGDTIRGVVIYVDSFGNLLTNIGKNALEGISPERIEVGVGGVTVKGLKRTYGDAPPGRLSAIIGSTGLLEIAANRAMASVILGAKAGEEVFVRKIKG